VATRERPSGVAGATVAVERFRCKRRRESTDLQKKVREIKHLIEAFFWQNNLLDLGVKKLM